jgi:DNA-binding PadR family transcriptional regulator
VAKEHKEFLTSLNRLHVMHHAVQGELYGLCMMKELKRHGYRVSPGTLYPLLHVLQYNRLYRATKRVTKPSILPKTRLVKSLGALIEAR